MGNLNEDRMWQAVKSCDAAYDGEFFYAVKSTKIFCRPSCNSRTPLQKNILYFSLSSLAIESGFRPCKRCRPDLLLEISSEESVIQVAKQIIEQEYTAALTLDELSVRVRLSKYHLQRLFKKKLGQTPLEYITNMRLHKAKELLEGSEASITEIAYGMGYKSSAYFSTLFSKHFGCSPKEYRILTRGD